MGIFVAGRAVLVATGQGIFVAFGIDTHPADHVAGLAAEFCGVLAPQFAEHGLDTSIIKVMFLHFLRSGVISTNIINDMINNLADKHNLKHLLYRHSVSKNDVLKVIPTL